MWKFAADQIKKIKCVTLLQFLILILASRLNTVIKETLTFLLNPYFFGIQSILGKFLWYHKCKVLIPAKIYFWLGQLQNLTPMKRRTLNIFMFKVYVSSFSNRLKYMLLVFLQSSYRNLKLPPPKKKRTKTRWNQQMKSEYAFALAHKSTKYSMTNQSQKEIIKDFSFKK